MSLLAITDEGVAYKDAVFAGEELQNITRVIFRNIDGLLPETAIDLTQSVPSTDIVHSEPIERVSALDDNAVVMSTVLGYDVGNFEYNWYGVVAQKEDLSEVLIAVVQTPVQTKTKTEGPTTGNYSVKSIVWKTANIAESLNVTLSALPWQLPENTFVTQAAYDLAMAEKLDKNADAKNALKLEGKSKTQVVAEAQTGMASTNHNHDLSYLDKGHWPTIANHTDTQHDIIFKAGKIIDSTAQVGINLVSSIVKRIDAAWVAGNGNGGLFSGSVAANTTYHCYVMIKGDGSVDAGFSISATASDIPNGYVAYRRIGSITVDHSANIRPFHQHGDTFLMKYQVYTLLSNSDDGAAQILDLRYVPKGLDNLVGKVSCFISSTDQTYGVVISSVFEGVLSASALNTPLYMYYSQAPCVATAEMEIALDSTTTIRKKGITAGSGHACRIVGKGWIDDRTQ